MLVTLFGVSIKAGQKLFLKAALQMGCQAGWRRDGGGESAAVGRG